MIFLCKNKSFLSLLKCRMNVENITESISKKIINKKAIMVKNYLKNVMDENYLRFKNEFCREPTA